jgi:hypothetical protein
MDYFTKCLKKLFKFYNYDGRRNLLHIRLHKTQSLMKVVFIISRSYGIFSFRPI